MGFEHLRVSKAGAVFNHASLSKTKRRAEIEKRAGGSCLTGGFYKTPTSSQSIDSLYPLNITWDTSCLTPANDKADIYLFAPKLDNPRLHLWSGVTFSEGSYNATLKPRWWNSSSSIDLELLIIQEGDAPFMATLPAGPIFTATYTQPSSGTPETADTSLGTSGDGITQVDAPTAAQTSSNRGKMAAAILLPLLAIIGLGVFAYLRISRQKGREKRKQWAEGVDKRMSTISTDWKSMTGAGAAAAVRNSMAVNADGTANPRASSFSFGAIRPPSSVYGADGGYGQAGVGAMHYNADGQPQMTQVPFRGTGVGLRSSAYSNAAAATRVSRVSFAESAHPRPSGESRRSAYERRSIAGQSRAFHYDGSMPPMPEGAAERASVFVGGINPALVRGNPNPNLNNMAGMGIQPRLNISTSTVGSPSRLSRFDEVYGEDGTSSTYAQEASRMSRADSMYAAYGAYAYGGEEDENQTPGSQTMSPIQTAGAPMLSQDDIRKRALGEEDVGPALNMMRAQDAEDLTRQSSLPSFPMPTHYEYTATPTNGYDRNETLFTTSPVTPGFPTASFGQAITDSPISTEPEASFNPTYTSTSSYFPPTPKTAGTFGEASSTGAPMSPITGMAPPVNAMSPDDMLKMYAERNKAGSRAASRGATASPVARKASLNMSRSSTPANDHGRQGSGGNGTARPILPASPGSYSATRGAYGVSGLDD